MQLATAGAAVSIAGCNSLQPSTDDGAATDDPGGSDLGDVSATAVTALVQPSQDELIAIQQELDAEIEAGELDEMEAQQEFRERQLELIQELADSFEADAEEADAFAIEESMPEQGAFLVDGDAEALVAELNDGDLAALLPGQEFVDAHEQTQQAEGELDEEALEEELEEEPEDDE